MSTHPCVCSGGTPRRSLRRHRWGFRSWGIERQLPAAPEEIPEWKQTEQKEVGRTNLLPLFNKVDEMLRNKEVISMKGLIVMCSQPGIFPYRMPPYHVAFVFVNRDYSVPDVPPWGIRMIMQEDELL